MKRKKIDWSTTGVHLEHGALVTEAQAVRMTGETRKWIRDKVARGKVVTVEIDGQRLIKLSSLILTVFKNVARDDYLAVENWVVCLISKPFLGPKKARRRMKKMSHSAGDEK